MLYPLHLLHIYEKKMEVLVSCETFAFFHVNIIVTAFVCFFD
jgi:hypothetical protein